MPNTLDPDQLPGSICECERGPRLKYKGGCAECESVEAGRNHNVVVRGRRSDERDYIPTALSRGEVRRFLERSLLWSGYGSAER